jgi:hypothetical protein
VRLIGTRKRWLPVLTPQAILGLSVHKAIRVDKGDQVEVVVVKERTDEIVFAVSIDQLVSKIFDSHGGDPLAGMCGAVPEDRLVLAFPILAPKVYAFLGTAFERLAGDESLRVRKGVGNVI